MGRPKGESKLRTPEHTTRVPARISEITQDELRELCLIKLRRPIEVVIGEWIEERLAQEKKRPSSAKK